jgi:hypothetical protein
MTEQEWLECTDPESMLRFLWSRKPVPSDRKARLCMIAWCWQVQETFISSGEAFALDAVTQWTDGRLTLQEYLTRKDTSDRTYRAYNYIHRRDGLWGPLRPVWCATTREQPIPLETLLLASSRAAELFADVIGDKTGFWDTEEHRTDEEIDAFTASHESDQRAVQADILRHIMANPFRSYSRADYWPQAVVQLAEALYNGQDCSFALHDALIEAGHPELAAHFQEPWHRKGCWVVDLVLGKS